VEYRDAEAALETALTFGIHPSLVGISELCGALEGPQDAFRIVQVTGTNGKTSTVRITEALLRAEGLATGLYTSPHLERYPERIEVGGRVVTDTQFAEAVSAVLDAAETLRPGAQGTDSGFTEFELLTAAAFWTFRRHGVEVAVLEVGLGGRWDATSVAAADVAVIIGVGLDHTAILGDTLEAIAGEKAAIIRPGAVAVLGPGTAAVDDVLLTHAAHVCASVRRVREAGPEGLMPAEAAVSYSVHSHPTTPDGFSTLDVKGALGIYPALSVSAPAYQAGNIATAVAAAEALTGHMLDVAHVRCALRDLTLPGRFELVRTSPPVIVDGSHNPQAAGVLAGAIRDAWPRPGRRPVVLLGVLSDKDAEGMVAALTSVAGGFAVVAPSSPRARSAADLAAVVARVTGEEPPVFSDVRSALEMLSTTARDGLVVTGSLTTAGEARALLRRDG